MGKSLRRLLIYGISALVVIPTAAIVIVQVKIAIAQHKTPQPQTILVLGGGSDREPVAAKLAAQQPKLTIWVSNGLPPARANKLFLAADVSLTRVNLDYRATDTVTNFTTIVAELRTQNIRHLYLVTSDFHMGRANAIAFWVLGSHGIAYTPVSVPSKQTSEPLYKLWRDVIRSWLWLLTGRTGSRFDPNPPSKPL